MIRVDGLKKSFPPVVALDGVAFEARDGEVTGLIGPNGAGKTTALRILYTVMKPDSGAALVDGFDTVNDRRAVQSRIGVLPDARGLYPRLTAREHVRYYGRLHGLGGAGLERRIEELFETLGIGDFADRRARGFSKGQTRKVAMARALVHEPHNVLMDEPTNGLDVASTHAVHRMIDGWRRQGRCVLFCSHIMQEVAAVADRIVVLAAGRVVAEGTLAALLAKTGTDNVERMFLTLTGQPEGW